MSVSAVLDGVDDEQARALLLRCCSAQRWVEGMLGRRPFASDEAVYRAADEIWAQMNRDDVLAALAGHPEIGGDLEALRARFASTASWSAQEQAGVQAATEATLRTLRDGNLAYRERFGYVFVVCATGKRADEMLEILHRRLANEPHDELRIAAAEQAKITRIRLEKLS